jgi:hypothetical protein
MSRSGYSDDCEHLALWRGAVHRATTGYRGQHFLRKLRDALDAMPVKRLIADAIQNATGEVCALGALDPSPKSYEARDLANHFGIAWALAAEIVYENDEAHRFSWIRDIDGKFIRRDETPEDRWARMRAWVDKEIRP